MQNGSFAAGLFLRFEAVYWLHLRGVRIVLGLFSAWQSRPGGSALNAGQVGSLRAAQYISSHPNELVDERLFSELTGKVETGFSDDTDERISAAQRRMSDNAAAVRDIEKIKLTLKITLDELKTATDPVLRDVLLTQGAVLTAMANPNTDPESVQEVALTENGFESTVRKVRPIPQDDAFFENVWRNYRENKNIF